MSTHTPRCLARAIICAVENVRDAMADPEPWATLQTADLALIGQEYLDDGMLQCICPRYLVINPALESVNALDDIYATREPDTLADVLAMLGMPEMTPEEFAALYPHLIVTEA